MEATRPQSPTKRTFVVGSSAFLTKLAAQERRVLELREELEKAELDLTKLKKQWAQQEAVKKRNEFRHQEQLRRVRTESCVVDERTHKTGSGRVSRDVFDGVLERTLSPSRSTPPAGGEKLGNPVRPGQTQRKVFAGSRHTKTLSLLSRASSMKASSGQPLYKLVSQESFANQADTSASNGSRISNSQRPLSHVEPLTVTRGQPKEVFIETGKQFVGDIREGLWTFFEDLRQATVGEEASSIPNTRDKPGSRERSNGRLKESRDTEDCHTPKASARVLDGRCRSATSGTELNTHQVVEQQLTVRGLGIYLKQAQIYDNIGRSDHICDNTSNEDLWDPWDTPVAKDTISRSQTESATSPSLASSSIIRDSPRSSMR